MKFKYVGLSEFRDLDLVLNGVMNETDVLIPNTTITVDDSKKELIKRLTMNGNFEIVQEKKNKVTRVKKKKTKNKED